jgi:hypothetical protein
MVDLTSFAFVVLVASFVVFGKVENLRIIIQINRIIMNLIIQMDYFLVSYLIQALMLMEYKLLLEFLNHQTICFVD